MLCCPIFWVFTPPVFSPGLAAGEPGLANHLARGKVCDSSLDMQVLTKKGLLMSEMTVFKAV